MATTSHRQIVFHSSVRCIFSKKRRALQLRRHRYANISLYVSFHFIPYSTVQNLPCRKAGAFSLKEKRNPRFWHFFLYDCFMASVYFRVDQWRYFFIHIQSAALFSMCLRLHSLDSLMVGLRQTARRLSNKTYLYRATASLDNRLSEEMYAGSRVSSLESRRIEIEWLLSKEMEENERKKKKNRNLCIKEIGVPSFCCSYCR